MSQIWRICFLSPISFFLETFPPDEELSVLCCCQELLQSLLMQQELWVFEKGIKVAVTLGECVQLGFNVKYKT